MARVHAFVRSCTCACVRASVHRCMRLYVRACVCAFFHSLMVSCRKSDQAGDASVQSGMVTYTIPGIAFGMPSSVGPLHFAPVFTSRHTAEIAWVQICLRTGCIILLQSLAKRANLRPNACLVMASATHSVVVAICLCMCVFVCACLSTYLFAGALTSQAVMSMTNARGCVHSLGRCNYHHFRAFMFAG